MMSSGRLSAALFIALAGALAAPASARADSDTLGPVTATDTNCGTKFTINVMILNCINAAKCDYAVGTNNFSGGPIAYTLAVEAPPGYQVYAQGKHVSKSYEAVKVVSAPQNPKSPKVKVGVACEAR
jgi:hypothetical protein